jgi:2-polyprenyl-3-methyl-5-hydroxy-6-metoxy-1,4-benzoquinol methylase
MSFSGERLPLQGLLFNPMRIENLARYQFAENYLNGAKILDMGCGFGEGLRFFERRNNNKDIFGIDRSMNAIKNAKESESSKIYYSIMDIENVAFPENFFDLIISFETIEHLNAPMDFINEAYRLLKPSCQLILTTPNKLVSSPNSGSLWPDHIQEFTPDELKRLLQNRFTNVKILGERIPIFESHPVRKIVHKIAPYIKPLLPKFLRINSLPFIQSIIKNRIGINEVYFSREDEQINHFPTLVAVCKKNAN